MLSKMAVKTVYSQKGDVAKDHSRYWSGFFGMYLRTGLALRAYCMQFRCKEYHYHIYVLFCLENTFSDLNIAEKFLPYIKSKND